MMAEFVGSTGAGKTTLAADVHRRLTEARERGVATSIDLVAERIGCRPPAHPTRQNLLSDIVGFPFFVRSTFRHRAFPLFAARFLARQRGRIFLRLNRLRNVVRKIGTYEIVQRHGDDRIVLVDEGTVLAAHNLFGDDDTAWGPEDLQTFARLVPLPDAIVCVTAPVDELVRRSLARPDPPRMMRARDESRVERHVRRAVDLFEDLLEVPRIRERAMIVENAADTAEARVPVVDRIVRFLLDERRRSAETTLSGARS